MYSWPKLRKQQLIFVKLLKTGLMIPEAIPGRHQKFLVPLRRKFRSLKRELEFLSPNEFKVSITKRQEILAVLPCDWPKRKWLFFDISRLCRIKFFFQNRMPCYRISDYWAKILKRCAELNPILLMHGFLFGGVLRFCYLMLDFWFRPGRARM